MDNQINNPQPSANGKTITGIILLGLGVLILFKHLNFFFFPHWLITWPIMMIGVGLYIGAKHNFRKSNWIFITMIGVIFLLPNIMPGLYIGMLWPLLMIAIGVSYLLRRNHRWERDHWEKRDDDRSFDNNI